MLKSSIIFVLGLLMFSLSVAAKSKAKILVFTKTMGFRHASIKDGQAALFRMARENNFEIDTTSDAGKFTDDNLSRYAVLIFLNSTGMCAKLFNEAQKQAMQRFIRNGKGFVGIHAATDTCYDWDWYGNLVGAYFGSHPADQTAILRAVSNKHPTTKHLPAEWKKKDEWYNFKWVSPNIKVLIYIDETSYKPGRGAMGDKHPISWYQEFDGGRSFYTTMGHTEESYTDPLFLKHLLEGIKYAAGKKYKL